MTWDTQRVIYKGSNICNWSQIHVVVILPVDCYCCQHADFDSIYCLFSTWFALLSHSWKSELIHGFKYCILEKRIWCNLERKHAIFRLSLILEMYTAVSLLSLACCINLKNMNLFLVLNLSCPEKRIHRQHWKSADCWSFCGSSLILAAHPAFLCLFFHDHLLLESMNSLTWLQILHFIVFFTEREYIAMLKENR